MSEKVSEKRILLLATTVHVVTVMCLSIGTPKNYKFSIVSNGKLIISRCSEIWANYSPIIISLNIGPLKNH